MTDREERYEAEISALIDGELDHVSVLEVVDDLVDRSEGRDFYRRARRLGGLLEQARESSRAGDLPPDLWRRIEREWAEGGGHDAEAMDGVVRPWPRSVARWSLRVAAAAAIAVAAWTVGRGGPIQDRLAGDVVRIELASDAGAMTDERFVALAAELLRADRRYHLAMGEIMDAVTRQVAATEGSPEGSAGSSGPFQQLRAASFVDRSDGDQSRPLWY